MPAHSISDNDEALSIVQLLAAVATMSASSSERLVTLLDGLCELVHAEAWMQFASESPVPHNAVRIPLTLQGGSTGFIRIIDPSPIYKLDPACLCHQGKFDLSILDSPMIRGGDDKLDPLLMHLWQKLERFTDADPESHRPWIVSIWRTTDHRLGLLGLFGRSDRLAISPRQSKIASILLREISACVAKRESTPDHLEGLSPRLRQVLAGLLDGESRKEIAANLDLSIHTVSDYIANIYRRFGVRSQSDLIRRLLLRESTRMLLLLTQFTAWYPLI